MRSDSLSTTLKGLRPIEAAERLRHLPGLIFFDTALEQTGEEISIVSAAPTAMLRGSLERDAPLLVEALRRQERLQGGKDRRMVSGFAGGWVEYDGDYCFGIYERALCFHHQSGAWEELGDLSREFRDPERSARGGEVAPAFRAERSAAEYCAMVRRAQDYIAAGDIYQVNLAHRFQAAFRGDPFAFYHALRDVSPAPMAAFLDLGGRTVLSASPESFLEMNGRSVQTRPIKGTRPRCANAQADANSAYDLMTSPKEHAELLMITDLERSDLGRVCVTGSVRVPELLALEGFEQVFHLVSTVQGTLRPDVSHVAALQACFPGGSITGAPKKRAQEIIAELEPAARGLYTGAIGYFGFNGRSRFNIAIRTVVIEEGVAQFHAGAGIVADSIPAHEWEETLHKAAGILAAANLRAR